MRPLSPLCVGGSLTRPSLGCVCGLRRGLASLGRELNRPSCAALSIGVVGGDGAAAVPVALAVAVSLEVSQCALIGVEQIDQQHKAKQRPHPSHRITHYGLHTHRHTERHRETQSRQTCVNQAAPPLALPPCSHGQPHTPDRCLVGEPAWSAQGPPGTTPARCRRVDGASCLSPEAHQWGVNPTWSAGAEAV